jgi:hypothetical protein
MQNKGKRKQFQTLTKDRRPRSYKSLHGKRPKESMIYTSNEHKEAEQRLLAAGDWCQEVLLTLSPRAKRYDPEWIVDIFTDALRTYYNQTRKIVNYHFVSNRGRSGRGQCSAHVVFEEPLPDLEFLERCLVAGGLKTKVTTAGEAAVFYMAENIAQPDSLERSSKWRDHERK